MGQSERPRASSPAPQGEVLLINGSLRGRRGNSQKVVDLLASFCRAEGEPSRRLDLSSFDGSVADLGEILREAHAFILVSGCVWGGAGSVTQRFLEVVTRWEVSDRFLGKPAAVVVTMHSVGGLEAARVVASTLQLLGCLLPPLGTIALSRVGQMALASGNGLAAGDENDIWRTEDLRVLTRNVLRAAGRLAMPWEAWPVARAEAASGPYPSPGPVDFDEPPWL